MKKALVHNINFLYHYVDGERIEGKNRQMSGNCSHLIGNCSNLRGNCSCLGGNCSNLSGDCSGLSGDCSNLSGDLDACDISEEERKNGIDIGSLVMMPNKGLKDEESSSS